MHFLPTYSIIILALTIAIAALNTDTVSQTRNANKARTGLVESESKGKERNEDINEPKQDDVEQKGVTSQTEAINSIESKSKTILPKLTNSPDDKHNIKSKVTEDQSEVENYSEGLNLASPDNEDTGDGFLSDLLDYNYDEIDDMESDEFTIQTQPTIDQPEAKNNVKSDQVPNEIEQTDSLEQENNITLEENDTLETKLSTLRPQINDSKSKPKKNKTVMSLDTPIEKDQFITADNTKSELEMNMQKTNEVETNSEATNAPKSEDNVIDVLELNINAQSHDTNAIASTISSTAGDVTSELTTNQTTISLKPIKHRQSLCSRLFKLIRTIFFPWRRLYNKLKCALLSPIQGSSSQNVTNIM